MDNVIEQVTVSNTTQESFLGVLLTVAVCLRGVEVALHLPPFQ